MNKFVPHVLEVYEYGNVQEMIFESLPRGYNIPSVFSTLGEVHKIPDKTKITVFGYIDKIETKATKSKKLSILKAKLYKDGESINLQWTTSAAKAGKMEYGLKMKIKEGQLIQVTGKVSSFDINGFIYKYIDQPILNEITESENDNASVIIPEPMYNLTKGIKTLQVQNGFRELIQNFDSIDKKDFMPLELEKRLKMRSLKESLEYTHGLRPIQIDKFLSFLDYDGFRKRILVEKIWRIMIDSQNSKKDNKTPDINFVSEEGLKHVKEVIKKLPFELTNNQKKAIWSMLTVFSKKEGTNNLVFGDVGSGKTMVALIVSYVLMQYGFQCALLAPTSILANQHFQDAIELFGDKHENIFIVHSKTKKKEKDKINKILSSGEPAIVLGTSSINKLNYTNLKVLFIDEEQKFGVKDKEFLKNKFEDIHSVYMTATPIPRTLAGAMYTNFNIFKIEEKPAIQKPRITKVIEKLSREEVNFIKDRVLNHKDQMLVIVPAIASNDLISSKTAEEKYGKIFPEFKISTINGRMKPENIEKNTKTFMDGEIDLLIATTMVDAGFSNKNLSFVFIENADRFGIAQMHQIRGRVGRAEKQGYCYLVPGGNIQYLKEKTRDRLMSLVESENGFDLSMKDIEQRGSGDLRGTVQSGSEVNMLDWINEIEIINQYLSDKLDKQNRNNKLIFKGVKKWKIN